MQQPQQVLCRACCLEQGPARCMDEKQSSHACSAGNDPTHMLVGAYAMGSAVMGCSCDWCELASALAVESMGLLPPAPPVPYTPVDTTATSAPTKTQAQMTAGRVLSCTAPGVPESCRVSAVALWMVWLPCWRLSVCRLGTRRWAQGNGAAC